MSGDYPQFADRTSIYMSNPEHIFETLPSQTTLGFLKQGDE